MPGRLDDPSRGDAAAVVVPGVRLTTTVEEEQPVITAIVFIKAEVSQIPEVAEQVAALAGVSEVYSVTGGIDLIALLRVRRHEQVAELVPDSINKVPGVLSTETHIAFRTYSSHDLEAAFSLGPE